MNAQNKFDRLLEEVLKPFFKENEFKTPAKLFYKDYEEFRKLFQVQKSRTSTTDFVKFTFNISIFDKYLYEKIGIFGSSKNPNPAICILEKRIGSLLPSKNDKWYEIDKNSNMKRLENEIIYDLKNYVIPYFEKFKNQSDLLKEYKTEIDPFITIKPLDLYIAIHELQQKDNRHAKVKILEYYNKWGNKNKHKNKLLNIMKEFNITVPNNGSSQITGS